MMQTEFPERYITLGLKIAYYRKKAGLTQEVLAERIGKSVNFVGPLIVPEYPAMLQSMGRYLALGLIDRKSVV